jgi:hypothetical protein
VIIESQRCVFIYPLDSVVGSELCLFNNKEVAARAALERLTSRGPHSSLSRAFRSLSHRIGKLCKAGESTVNCNLFRDMAKLKSINLDSIPEEDLKQIEYTWDKVVADLLRI